MRGRDTITAVRSLICRINELLPRQVAALAVVAAVAAAMPASEGAAAPVAAVTSARGAVLATEGCTHGIRRPKTIVFFCGDAGAYLTNLRWSRWGGSVAVGTGVYTVKLCEPDCASGGVSTAAVTVHLYRRRSCPDRSHLYYHRATMIETSGRRVGQAVPCPF